MPSMPAFLVAVLLLGGQAAPEVLPRSAWGARPADAAALQAMGPVRHLTVHHTAVPRLRGDGSPEAELRAIQRGHQEQGWGDIAYHFLIAPDGRVFAGRDPAFAAASGTRYLAEAQWRAAPVVTPDLRDPDPAGNRAVGGTLGAGEEATGPRPGRVAGHLTVCLLGDFSDVEPTPAARRTLVALAAHLLQRNGLGPGDLWVHREVAASACPGDRLYAWLRSYPQGPRYAPGPVTDEIARRLEGLRATR